MPALIALGKADPWTLDLTVTTEGPEVWDLEISHPRFCLQQQLSELQILRRLLSFLTSANRISARFSLGPFLGGEVFVIWHEGQLIFKLESPARPSESSFSGYLEVLCTESDGDTFPLALEDLLKDLEK